MALFHTLRTVRVTVTVTLSLMGGWEMGAKRICIIVFEPSLVTKSEYHAKIRDRGGKERGEGAGIGLALSI